MVLKPEPKRRGLLQPPWGLADVSVSKNLVRSLLLHKVILSIENFVLGAQKNRLIQTVLLHTKELSY